MSSLIKTFLTARPLTAASEHISTLRVLKGAEWLAIPPTASHFFISCSLCAPCRSFDLTQSPLSLLCALVLFSKGSDAYEHTARVTGTSNTPNTLTYTHHVSKGSIHDPALTHFIAHNAHIYIQCGYIRIGLIFSFFLSVAAVKWAWHFLWKAKGHQGPQCAKWLLVTTTKLSACKPLGPHYL